MLQNYGKSDVTYDWYAGNSGVVGRSGKFIAAHAAHAGLMMFWAGAFGLFELAISSIFCLFKSSVTKLRKI